MSFNTHDASFIAVLPTLRAREQIVAEVGLATSGRAGDVARSTLAEIELHISDGDRLYRQGRCGTAQNEFQIARGLIYQTLHPAFDLASYVSHASVALLPVSPEIENSLLTASSHIVDVIRPEAVEMKPSYWPQSQDAVPQALQSHLGTGFREAIASDESLQLAGAQGVALLKDNRPEAALAVLEQARDGTANAAEVDPGLAAALELNIAVAHLQSGNPQRAMEAGRVALQHFERADDAVGIGQAFHLLAVGSERSGLLDDAPALFERAAAVLHDAPIGAGGAPSTAPGVAAEALAIALNSSTFAAGEAAPVRAVALRVNAFASRDVTALQSIANRDARTLTYRVPGRADGWGSVPVLVTSQVRQQARMWQLVVPIGETTVSFELGNGKRVAVNELVSKIYDGRRAAQDLGGIDWRFGGGFATNFYLTHLYGYVLPVKLGDCCRDLGLYAKAEAYFVQAAGYGFLNAEVEATALWVRIGGNAIDWGTSLYKNDDVDGAKAQYTKIISDAAGAPGSLLYTTASLAVPATAAAAFIAGILERPLPSINADIGRLILGAHVYVQQIAEGLDFYGLLLSPIHTFEYLQGVGRGFANEAIAAEREFVNFKTRQEAEEASRRDLETAAAMASAEAETRAQQKLAAKADADAATSALGLAETRLADAKQQRRDYEAMSTAELWGRVAAQALSGGEDAFPAEIGELADKLARGENISGGRGPKQAAAQTLLAGRKTQAYELQKMQDNLDELAKAVDVAKAQLAAAQARTGASEIAWQAALQRVALANAALAAFDREQFTPETWRKMTYVMADISRNYLDHAIKIAKLMERAYNFENDTALKVIKNEYGHDVGSGVSGNGLKQLGGDSLLQDIESFTYHAITHRTRKTSRIKDVVSLSAEFPAQFEEFRRTGLLSFETELYEFDRRHPGFCNQRIEAVEVEVIGLLPDSGLHGTLTAGGVTRFRKQDNTAATRVHVVDTMALSEFVVRNDGFLYQADTGVRGLFQGIGVSSTWQLRLPRRSNDFDFRRIFDVQFILYYTAQFSAGLRDAVLALPPRPGELALLKNFGLRYDFPDAWYGFYRGGGTTFALDRFRLPMNQQNFKIGATHVRLVTRAGVSNQGIDVQLTAPGGISGTATTDAAGMISTDGPELAAMVGADPIGVWKAEVLGGAPLDDAGTVKFDRVYNLQFGLEYTFEYVPEGI
jgi:hypothetical protein